MGNKVYENGTLKRILVDNGYIENGQYHFYVKDYLGNNVVTTNHTGQTVSQRQSYYPFGASVADVSLSQQQVQPYKYNAKELDSHNGLNLYDYHARQYDPALGRFTTMDPLAEQYYSTSPYAYCGNNPVKYTDPTGMAYDIEVVCDEEGRYRFIIVGGTLNYDQNIYLVQDGVRTGEVIGKTLTQHSFFDENGNVVEGAVLDLLDLSGMDFINNEIIADDPGVIEYMTQAYGDQHYDFKVRDMPEGLKKIHQKGNNICTVECH